MSKGNPDAPNRRPPVPLPPPPAPRRPAPRREPPVQFEQRCAVCEGRGQVPPDFYADQCPLVASHVPCRRCDGRGSHAPLLAALPGDTVIVRVPEAVSDDTVAFLTNLMRAALPVGVGALVLTGGATIQVVRP